MPPQPSTPTTPRSSSRPDPRSSLPQRGESSNALMSEMRGSVSTHLSVIFSVVVASRAWRCGINAASRKYCFGQPRRLFPRLRSVEAIVDTQPQTPRRYGPKASAAPVPSSQALLSPTSSVSDRDRPSFTQPRSSYAVQSQSYQADLAAYSGYGGLDEGVEADDDMHNPDPKRSRVSLSLSSRDA
jgi:hypothetical protein